MAGSSDPRFFTPEVRMTVVRLQRSFNYMRVLSHDQHTGALRFLSHTGALSVYHMSRAKFLSHTGRALFLLHELRLGFYYIRVR